MLFPIDAFVIGGLSTDLQIKVLKCGTLEPERPSRLFKTQGKSGPCPGGLNPPLWALLGRSSAVAKTVSCGGGEVLDLGVHKNKPRTCVLVNYPSFFFYVPLPLLNVKNKQTTFTGTEFPVLILFPPCFKLVALVSFNFYWICDIT